MSTSTAVLNELLEPVSRCLTPEAAKLLVELRASPATQARIEELAVKCAEDRLSKQEQTEYDTYVAAGTFVAILQSKARKMLDTNAQP